MSREPLPDALRALALLGVMLVNIVGYPEAPIGALLGQAARHVGDSLTQFLLAAFVQGKAYPLLSMLFGMGLVWAARGRTATEARARFAQRQRRLLLVGVLHGVFIYFGDILTLYAITGWSLRLTLRARGAVVRRKLRRALVGAALAVGAIVLLAVFAPSSEAMRAGSAPSSFRATDRVSEFLVLNASVYVSSSVVGLVLALPIVRLCMLAGVAAARLRLLTHRRWQPWRHTVLRRIALAAVAANVAYGAAVAFAMRGSSDHLFWADALSPVVGLPLATCYALLLAQRWHRGERRWAYRLAPLGRRTLTVYIATSIACVVLFSGLGLALPVNTSLLVAMITAGWMTLVMLASRSTRRWPLEWLMGRRLLKGRA